MAGMTDEEFNATDLIDFTWKNQMSPEERQRMEDALEAIKNTPLVGKLKVKP